MGEDLWRQGCLASAGAVALGVSLGCAPASSGGPEPANRSTEAITSALHLNFEEFTAEYDAVVPAVRNAGTAEVRTAVVTAGGGRVRLAPTLHGAGLRFPERPAAGAGGGAAAVVVWDPGGALSPGATNVAWGAVLRLDATSESGTVDNGDNVLQRGTFADASQLKLQVDHAVPSCRVKGTAGEVVTRAGEGLERERWYRVVCTRAGESLHLHVQPLEGEALTPRVSTVRGTIGSVDFATSVPWSVGAKVSNDGVITTSATDQFNGVVDEVHVSIDSSIGGW